MKHICISKLITIDSDNGLLPGQRQAIIWTNAGILLTGPLGTSGSEMLIKIQIFSLMKIRLEMSSAKCCPFRLSLNVLSKTSCRLEFINIITGEPWNEIDFMIIKGHMMTSSNGNIFLVTGHLCGEFTGPRWIPRTKASDAELWCFLWSASE